MSIESVLANGSSLNGTDERVLCPIHDLLAMLPLTHTGSCLQAIQVPNGAVHGYALMLRLSQERCTLVARRSDQHLNDSEEDRLVCRN